MSTADRPLVSVGIVAYNSALYLPELLRSIETQVGMDPTRTEIVIADDGSADSTPEIGREYAARNPNARFIGAERNSGITANSNVALSACNGRYCVMTGADDVFLPNRLRDQLAWFERNPAGVVCDTGVEVIESETGRVLRRAFDPYFVSQAPRRKIVSEYTQLPSSRFMFDRSKCPDMRYDPRLHMVSDWLFWNQLLFLGTYGSTGTLGLRYRRHRENATAPGASKGYIEDRLLGIDILLAQYPQLVRACRVARANVLAAESRRQYLAGDRQSAQRYGRAALQEIPWHRRALETMAAIHTGAVGRQATKTVRSIRKSG